MYKFNSSANPTSAVALCSLFCQIQLFGQAQCLPMNTSTTTSIGATTTSITAAQTTATTSAPTNTTLISSATTLQPCPSNYLTDPAQRLLCALWLVLQSMQNFYSSNPSLISPVVESTSCLYRQVWILWEHAQKKSNFL